METDSMGTILTQMGSTTTNDAATGTNNGATMGTNDNNQQHNHRNQGPQVPQPATAATTNNNHPQLQQPTTLTPTKNKKQLQQLPQPTRMITTASNNKPWQATMTAATMTAHDNQQQPNNQWQHPQQWQSTVTTHNTSNVRAMHQLWKQCINHKINALTGKSIATNARAMQWLRQPNNCGN